MPRNNLWNIPKEIKVPFETRDATIRLYEKVIVEFRNSKGWLEEINIGVKQSCSLSPTLFGISIDKLESCLEEALRASIILAGIVVNLLIYADDVFLLVRCPFGLEKHLIIFKGFWSNTSILVNTDKAKVMIIKSKKITYANFVYDNNKLEEVNSYKYLGVDLHQKLNCNYNIKRRINEGWKSYFGLDNCGKSTDL